MISGALGAAALGMPGCGDGEETLEPGDEARALPDVGYCDPARDWDDAQVELETRVLANIDRHRSSGADCGAYGKFRPAGALRETGSLRCAARVHAWDMATRAFVAHENPDGERPADRVAMAQGRYASLTETIASGDIAPGRVVDEIWMASAGSCAALMGDAFTFVGVGVHADPDGGDTLWTVVLAR